jgi:hypothetical protein
VSSLPRIINTTRVVVLLAVCSTAMSRPVSGADDARKGRLSVGGLTSDADAQVVDFSATNATRKERGDPLCDGILGGSFLKHYSAVVDHGRLKLHLRDPSKK